MDANKVTRRGVYKDLELSPYEYKTPYGDIYKFPSAKKLEIYTRDVRKEIERLEKAISRNDLYCLLPPEIVHMLHRYCYKAFYNTERER